jgi:hypothetical protein
MTETTTAPAIERFLLAVVDARMEDAAGDDDQGWGCYLILKIGGAYVVRTEPVPGAADRAHVEWYATSREGWDRFNALCAAD